MLQPISATTTKNAMDWAERSDYWLQTAAASTRRAERHQDNPAPLILNGHGVSLRIEQGALVIRDGFTHYPQTQIKFRFWPGQPALPSRILLLEGSGTLSFDVLSWLGEQGIPLARINWNGKSVTVASGTSFAADIDKLRWQYETRAEPAKRLAFAAALIMQKLTNSIATARVHLILSREVRLAISRAERSIAILQRKRFDDVREIMGIEGGCANSYFNAWQSIIYDWKSIERHPIPEEWYEFRGRAGRTRGRGPANRNAAHPINAMLNYAYAVTSAQLQIQAVAEGFDPGLGILHETQPGRSAFVLDMIEPLRPLIDAKILTMITSRPLHPADFIIRRDGVCRLSPQMARMVATVVASVGESFAPLVGLRETATPQKLRKLDRLSRKAIGS